jgi:putative flippase GtrA
VFELAVLSRYALVGVANTVVGYGLILVLDLGLGLRPWMANAAGYGLGMLLSYVLNRRFAFRSRRAHRGALPAFILTAAACWGLNLAVLYGALSAGLPATSAQALAVLSYTVSFYLFNRYAVFRRAPKEPCS